MGWYDRKVRRVRDLSCGDTRIFLELEVRRVECRRCGTVKRERLDFLADNPLYTKRFAYYVGRRCRSATIKDVAAEHEMIDLASARRSGRDGASNSGRAVAEAEGCGRVSVLQQANNLALACGHTARLYHALTQILRSRASPRTNSVGCGLPPTRSAARTTNLRSASNSCCAKIAEPMQSAASQARIACQA